MEFEIESDDGSIMRVAVVGDLAPDRPENQPLREKLGDTVYGRRVTLNMEQAPFITSPGLGWLLTNEKLFREAGGRCVLHSISPAVLQVMRLMQLDRRLAIAADDAEAASKVMEGQA